MKAFKLFCRGSTCVLKNKEFQDEVKSIKSFTSTKDNGEQVINKISNSNKRIAIRTYWTKSPWSSTIAYRVNNDVYYNQWKIKKHL